MTLNGVMTADARYLWGGWDFCFKWFYRKHSDYTNSPNQTAHFLRVKRLNEALVWFIIFFVIQSKP